jgi:hypothetical protein
MSRLRVAVKMGGGNTSAQKHCGEAVVVTACYAERCALVSDYECGALLPHRVWHILLGL